MKRIKKELTPMEKLTAGYESFIKGKETRQKGAALFNNVLTKAVSKKAKQRGSK